MASYDSPGFHNLMPGIPDREAAFAAPGSVLPDQPDTSGPLGDRLQRGTVGNGAVVAVPGGSLANADLVDVGPRDTMVPGEGFTYGTGSDLLSGVDASFLGSTAAGEGSGHAPHPNSANRS